MLVAHGSWAKEVTASYVVYASGFRVLSANLTYREKANNHYQAILDTKTSGFLGWIVPWEGVFESQGLRTNTGFKTIKHYSSTVWRDEVETKTYSYNQDGSFAGLTIEGSAKAKEVKQIESVLADHTTDILSATLSAINAQNCRLETDIFDGKRRFKTRYTKIKEGYLNSSNYNSYEGDAQLCEVEIEPISGKWHEKPRGWLSIQEQGRQKGALPSFWYASLIDAQEETQAILALPVKVIVHTKYGMLTMNLENISIKS